jgi:hypothetical protein
MERVGELARRAFLLAAASPAVAIIVGAAPAPRRQSLRIVVLGTRDEEMRRSSEVGIAEVRRMTSLLGVRFSCDIVAPGASVAAPGTADAIVLLSTAGHRLLPAPTAPIVAAISRDHTAPSNLFSIRASPAAKARALKAAAATPGVGVAEWHGSLFRYGAEQLNARLRAADVNPTADTWAAWLAIKVAAESVLRAPVDGVAAALTTMAFDAHKGVALSFGSDRYLRQPLYLVSAGTVVATLAPEEVEE